MLDTIVIENFQSFREPVEVPLAPITLLYGPNSAGKSAVLDALNFMNLVFAADAGKLHSAARRHHHQGPAPDVSTPIRIRLHGHAELNPGSEDEYSEASRDLFHLTPAGLDAPLGHEATPSLASPHLGEVYIEWFLDYDPSLHTEPVFSLDIDINGHPAFALKPGDVEGYEYTLTLDPTSFGEVLLAIAEYFGVDADAKGLHRATVQVSFHPLRVTPLQLTGDSDGFLHAMTALANWLLRRSGELCVPPLVVEADRGVIKDKDLVVVGHQWQKTQLFGRLGLPSEFTSLPDRELPGIRGGVYQSETRLSVLEWLALSSMELKAEVYPRAPGDSAEEAPDVYVNRCLSDHLFVDKGYQIRLDVCEVLPASGTREFRLPKSKRRKAAVVLCSLTDRDGRQLTFEDVGTGISCVMPVLAAWHAGYSFVQQPELHLHPALQAGLADVAIEACNRAHTTVRRRRVKGERRTARRRTGNVRQVIETHSEYILLRCLKRIRQTAQGLHPENSPQRLKPDQVSVLYFDPGPDGTTRVRRIRITEDGDFIDRWPRGFFEERGQELFGE
jgi:hypothetical protein